MNELHYLRKAIARMLSKLNAHSLNYVAEVEFYEISLETSGNLNDCVKDALGANSVVGGSIESNVSELMSELISGLSYVGDDGSHSNRGYVGTAEHKSDLDSISNKIRPFFNASSKVTSFWLKEGHPFYPVFWDFAFFIEGGNHKYILIGSSSD